jgi:phenylacetate-CoA ligase
MPTHYTDTADTAQSRFVANSFDDLMTERLATDAESAVLDLFRRTAEQVPAYRQFLQSRGISPEQITSFGEFRQLPLIDKQNYMRAYPLPARCRNGTLLGCDRIAVSSGSTGQPTFWPRSVTDELDITLRFEQVFHDSFEAHRRTTLAIVCFALGNWVGGLFTTSCCWHLARKGYPLMVATPGNRKDEIFRVLRELAPHFEQTVLLGYPPFIKDTIDAGIAEGIDWPRFRIKLVFAGEVFSEEWRSLVGRRIGSQDPCHDSASLYGTADAGVLGNETPLSIAIRRFLAANPKAARALFGESRLPTLVQYDPVSRFFEVHRNTLVVSGDNGVPLVRYHIADQGGILGYREIWDSLRDFGLKSLADYGLDDSEPQRPLPFVYVFGRADFTVSYYGANIYPENIAVGLEQAGITDWVSGKFVLEVRETPDGDKVLSITVELLPNVVSESEKSRMISESVVTELLRLNSEFANYVPREKQQPRVVLRPFEDPEYFPAGVKHRYTRR